jgi:hypothetical protein
MDIAPEAVTNQTLLSLSEALMAEEEIKNPKAIIENTISNWSRSARLRVGPG